MVKASDVKMLMWLTGSSLLLLFWFNGYKRTDHWSAGITDTGTNSSCRATDLNGDGIKDIVVGGGGREFFSSDNGVLAFDGRDGTLLWKTACRNQMVGSAIFMDVNGDSTDDVFIGGRSAQLLNIDGRTGALLWEYRRIKADSADLVNDTTLLNFYNPQLIPDIDNDRLPDLLVTFGGYVKALPDEANRPAGWMIAVSSRTGEELSRARSPDGREIYMSPVVFDVDNDGSLEVIFGTGGETMPGSLFSAELSDVLENDLSKAITLVDGGRKGFVAPPLLVDLNEDGYHEVVTTSVDGRLIAIDPRTFLVLWEFDMGREFETYAMAAPIRYGDTQQICFFVNFGQGVWPDFKEARQVLINGRDGQPLMQFSYGGFQYASPVVADITDDGHEDVIYVVNTSSEGAFGTGDDDIHRFSNEILIYDLRKNEVSRIGDKHPGTNLGSTPLVTDLDNDGYLDLVTCRMSDAHDFFAYKHLRVERIEIPVATKGSPVSWGSYMGSAYDAIYRGDK